MPPICLYRQQNDFWSSKARFRAFCGGRGAGKSLVGAFDMWTRAYEPEGRGRLYLIGAPTYGGLFDYTIRSFREVGKQIGVWNEDNFRASHPGPLYKDPISGSEFLFRSADNPERFRGPNLGGLWLDEASQYVQEAYDNAIACVRDGNYLGDVTATFTPKGITHWTYEVFGPDEEGNERPDHFLVRATSRDNPFLNPKFYRDLVDQYGERSRQAKQELEGHFLDAEGAEWPSDYFGSHIWFDEWPEKKDGLDPLDLRVMAIDPSKGAQDRTGDYSAIVELARGPGGILYCDADLNNARAAEQIVVDVIERARIFNPEAVCFEENNYQHMLTAEVARRTKERGIMLPVVGVFNKVNKEERIRRLGPYLERKLFRFKKGSRGAKMLVNQLRDFPECDHDDGPDALEMALRTMIDRFNRRPMRRTTRVAI